MATTDGILGSSPLKAPAVEIVDLLSDSESEKGPIANDLSDGEDNGEDQWSMYEDALAEMVDDGLADDCESLRRPYFILTLKCKQQPSHVHLWRRSRFANDCA